MIDYRELAWPDIPQLVALDRELFPRDAWPETTWWAELAGRPQRRYRVGVQGDRVVAYAGVDCPGEVADVMTIGVAADAQGGGAGRMLLDWMVVQAEDSGASALMLEVRDSNARARDLYSRNGFEQISVRRRYYQPEGEDAIVMRRFIGGAA
ncbi:ribosomal protein S18-alanine N-acetyltransferase [Calidifontibacter sp. DB0510]|uniref:[Ribosomal protein bS18]-alanine N-acetyltransferase n=1 Tax=Metallococcus carri TaxID=1656884 RepID=A0A967B8C6_9MICO|nr:ribosomal protein S18-alanine N-acetyltransferase [Metallococcus carri]NHN56651.1 ribosomal protein S18-alanine N-acetyltransferase [Metallococcus carri]NOP38950.1 ribosomal protein S18-alanine N-acetyltransferase [Calidifontibacter sp. DB2511S]